MVRVLRILPSNHSVAGRPHHLSVPVMRGPDNSTGHQQSLWRVAHVLNLEDEETWDGLDFEAFSDIFLFLGFHLESKDRIARRYSQAHD